MTLTILHISDMHVRSAGDTLVGRASRVAQALFPYLAEATEVLIVVSGDLAYSGQASQYDAIRDFLRGVEQGIMDERKVPVRFVVVPGNHDCNLDLDNGTRRTVISSLGRNLNDIDDSIIATCVSVQQPFFEFCRSLDRQSWASDQLWSTQVLSVDGKVISIECLNVAWVSTRHDEPGRLHFPTQRYQSKRSTKADLRIAVMHHPINWFGQASYRPFRRLLRSSAEIVFTGHEHEGDASTIDDAEAGPSLLIEGRAMQADGTQLSEFQIVLLDVTAGSFRVIPHRWVHERFEPISEGAWGEQKDLPKKNDDPFAVRAEFQALLDDPGAFLRHPGKAPLVLADIYVFPDVKRESGGDDEEGKRYQNSESLIQQLSVGRHIVISGPDKAGKT